MKDEGFPPGVVRNRAGRVGVLKQVPCDVWGHPDWAERSKTIERSTGTSDRAEGLRRAMRMLVELEAGWEECRRELRGRPTLWKSMTRAEVEAFAETVDTLVMLEHDPEAEPEGGLPLPEDPAELVEWAGHTLGRVFAPALLPVLRDAVAARLANQPPANARERYLTKAVERLAPQPRRRPTRTVDELIALFEAERLGSPRDPRTVSNYTTAFEVLREVVGGSTPLDQVDRDVMRAARDAICARPLAPSSKRKYARALGTLCTFAVAEGWMTANPGLGLAPERSPEEAAGDKRRFTDEELGALFPGGWRLETATDWVLALGLFQGMRGEEIAQLETGDIGEVEGVPVIHIRAWTPTPEGGRDYDLGKSVKNAASERTIPVHAVIEPALVALAAARRAAGERMLLPRVKRYGKEGFYGSVRKDLNARLTAAGVKSSRTTPHSLRHNFRDACLDAGVSRDHRLALGGWSLGKSAEADYGDGFKPAALKGSLDRLVFPVGQGPCLESATAEP